MSTLHTLAEGYRKARPEIRPGYTVRVHEKISEGGKDRIQIFEGLVIAVHKGSTPTDSTLTVRRIASGIGVERVFSLHSTQIEKIEVKKVAKVRRAKLSFLRNRHGKSARLSERFTTADEFAVIAPPVIEEAEPADEPEGAEASGEEVSTAEDAPAKEEPTTEAQAEEKKDAAKESK